MDQVHKAAAEKPEERRKGRPPKLSAAQVAELRETALRNPLLSLPDLTTVFCREAGVDVSRATVRKSLAAAGVVRTRPSGTKKSPGDRMGSRGGEPAGEEKSNSGPRYGYTPTHRDDGDEDRYPHGMYDGEWELVRDLFEREGPGCPPKHPRRQLLDACLYAVRAGCPWRMLPKDFPPWQAVYAQFRRWSSKGLFEEMHDRLRSMWREREHRAPEPTAAVLDSQSVKTSAQGGDKGFDAGKKVKGRKRHLVTDTLGLVLVVLVTIASVQDRDAAEPAMALAKAKYPTLTKSYVDAGYAGRCLDVIRRKHDMHVEVVRHPANRNVGRWHDRQLPLLDVPRSFTVLPKRWVIERTNAWNDRCRRLEKDQDRLIAVSASWVWLAQSKLLLRRLAAIDEGSERAA